MGQVRGGVQGHALGRGGRQAGQVRGGGQAKALQAGAGRQVGQVRGWGGAGYRGRQCRQEGQVRATSWVCADLEAGGR